MLRPNKNGKPYESKSDHVGTMFCPDCLKHFEDCSCVYINSFSSDVFDRKTVQHNPIWFDDISANLK